MARALKATADEAGDQRRARPLERGKEAAGGDEQKVRQQAPLIAAHVSSGVAREIGRLRRSPAESAPSARGRSRRRGRTRPLTRAPDASRAGAPRRSRPRQFSRRRSETAPRRRRCRAPSRLKEIEAERAGGERVRRQPAEHDEVGRGHRVDRDIGENDRPAERERRAELALERAASGCGFQRIAARRTFCRPGRMRGPRVHSGDGEPAQI